jgi:ketosteroid isomerase-like protein
MPELVAGLRGTTDTWQAMSENNVDVVRRAAEAFNEGGLTAVSVFFDEEIVFEEPPEQPAPRVARGVEEVLRVFGEFEEAWAWHRTEPEEIRAINSDQVLLFTVEHYRGRDGVEVSAPWGAIFTFRDGKIVRWQGFWDRGNALEAAGLSE